MHLCLVVLRRGVFSDVAFLWHGFARACVRVRVGVRGRERCVRQLNGAVTKD